MFSQGFAKCELNQNLVKIWVLPRFLSNLNLTNVLSNMNLANI
jgi:hypothetical protein